MTGTLLFDPLLPLPLIVVLAVIAALGIALALWRGMAGWPLRLLAALVVIAALASPIYQREERALLSDIVILLDDRSASQRLSDRPDQMETALEQIEAAIASLPNMELRKVRIDDGEDDTGTLMMGALSEVLAEEPSARIAGIIALSDGRLHDIGVAPALPAPLHLLMTGHETDWDRRLIVHNAPSFAIIGEPVTLTLRVEDQGAAPPDATTVELELSVDGGDPETVTVPIGQDIEIPVALPHAGRNVLQFTVAQEPGEITDRNNSALIQINGIRDRLRVLLVSGEPHAGGRTWRNLLKSDSSVDLVHFTILRPPEKQDGVPVDELSLIAFPTRELFLEKISDFDLIIFDRYKRRGILPAIYLDNVARYVTEGGAVLIAAGPDFAGADSIFRSPLSTVVPAEPTARVIEERYRPKITDLGKRHPVTTGLSGSETWGSWLRQIEVTETSGQQVMSGYDEAPLLILDRVGEGRVALLASDHAWLWSRGYEGGGPQLELLRRLAHWMMKEPDLEEEALWAEATGQQIKIIRQTLSEETGPVTLTQPDGTTGELVLEQERPGRFIAEVEGQDMGLYHIKQGDLAAVIGLGPAAPREFEETVASGDMLEPIINAQRGGILRLENGVPSIRTVRAGRPAAGRNWIGLTPRAAYETRSVSQTALLPPWLVLLLAASFITAAWLREGRR